MCHYQFPCQSNGAKLGKYRWCAFIEEKNVKRLVLLGCNAGHDDYSFENIAYYFRKKINGPCIASDGTVYSGPDCTKDSTFDSVGEKEWRDWRDDAGSKRKKNEGWLVYHNSKNISYFSKREVTLKMLLTFRKGKKTQLLAEQVVISSPWDSNRKKNPE